MPQNPIILTHMIPFVNLDILSPNMGKERERNWTSFLKIYCPELHNVI